MQIYMARQLSDVGSSFGLVHGWVNITHNEPFEPETLADLKSYLVRIALSADNIGLYETSRLAARIESELNEKTTGDELHVRINQLHELFNMQIELVRFFYVRKERLQYYQNPELAGKAFKTGFPNGNRELIEAGNCLALDRFTACVCHLMRALDIGLTALERQLGIVPPAKGPENTWGKILGRIKDQVDQNDETPPPGWAADKDFYQKAHAFLQAVKAPYRDATMHVKAVYDEESATSIFKLTVEVLRHFATKLAE